MSHVCAALFHIMSTAGHSQEFVERKAGVSQSTLSKVLNGADPSFETLLKLIAFYPKLLDAVEADVRQDGIGVP